MRRRAPHLAAERVVAAAPGEVFGFLADLENHWLLADRFVDVRSLERPPAGGAATGGAVRVRGPLGLGRTVRTRVVETHPADSIAGIARVGRRTEARVNWTLAPAAGGTLVRLEATVDRASLPDAILLGAGGRRWLERRFGSILATLADRLARAGPQRRPE